MTSKLNSFLYFYTNEKGHGFLDDRIQFCNSSNKPVSENSSTACFRKQVIQFVSTTNHLIRSALRKPSIFLIRVRMVINILIFLNIAFSSSS